LNIPNAFLYAGSTCVISTLWAIHDLSSALLMQRFHMNCRNGLNPGTALHHAQHWLRNEIQDGPFLLQRILPAFVENLDDIHLQKRCMTAATTYAQRFPNSPPFASPVHWAAFTATGLAYSLSSSTHPR
jgi:CHAT domain-containing protein